MTHHFYCSQDALRNVHLHTEGRLPPGVPAWEAFWKATLLHARWHQRRKKTKKNQAKVLMVRNWTSILDAIRSTPVHLHPTLVVEPGRMRKEPVSVRDRLNLTRWKLQCKVCLHPHIEQGGMPPF